LFSAAILQPLDSKIILTRPLGIVSPKRLASKVDIPAKWDICAFCDLKGFVEA
jgi:hypothetical protein